MIEATLRTNFYVTDPGSARARNVLSVKVNPELITELPLPRPKFEIFVYSPRVEGVHLRFGPVARGGLRWSDRREDFRTEVLGLVKAHGEERGDRPGRREGWLRGQAAHRRLGPRASSALQAFRRRPARPHRQCRVGSRRAARRRGTP